MTRHLLFAFAILFISASAIAQTNVSGNITQNTTWTKAGSPYVLTGNVGVPLAYTLTIEPGVTVQRSGDYKILVNGAVTMAGTAADSIVFETILRQNIANGEAFVEFEKSNLANSSLRYLVFRTSPFIYEHADNGTGYFEDPQIRVGLEFEGSQTSVKNSGSLSILHSGFFFGSIATGGYNTTADIRIDSCAMRAEILVGNFTGEFQKSHSEPMYVSHSTLVQSSVISLNNHLGFTFRNCTIDSTSFQQSNPLPSLTIDSSTVRSSLVFGGDACFITISNSALTNTPVINNPGRIIFTSSSLAVTDTSFKDFYDNPLYTLISANSIVISGSDLENFTSVPYEAIAANGNYNTLYAPFQKLQSIAGNRIAGFYRGVKVTNFDSIHLDSNTFYSQDTGYDITNYSRKDFSALYNYYNLQPGQTIGDLIYDQNDDLTYGLVTYTPYATSPYPAVLPVTLIRFAGSREGNIIRLNWQTSNDVNVSNFIVQKKGDHGFTGIGNVPASGAGASYSFTDASPLSGTNEYRLKITERSGTYAYSPVVPVLYNGIVKGWRVYPNPASSYIIIEYTAVNENTPLQLTDASGKVIKTMIAAPGSTQVRLNVGDVAKGIYKIVMKDDSQTESRTVLIK